MPDRSRSAAQNNAIVAAITKAAAVAGVAIGREPESLQDRVSPERLSEGSILAACDLLMIVGDYTSRSRVQVADEFASWARTDPETYSMLAGVSTKHLDALPRSWSGKAERQAIWNGLMEVREAILTGRFELPDDEFLGDAAKRTEAVGMAMIVVAAIALRIIGQPLEQGLAKIRETYVRKTVEATLRESYLSREEIATVMQQTAVAEPGARAGARDEVASRPAATPVSRPAPELVMGMLSDSTLRRIQRSTRRGHQNPR